MAHNNRTITNSNKKIKVTKVIEEREKTPEDLNNESTKTTKAKKSKSKNKQTASTTIPFGSVGNMGALEFLPNKVGRSKEKKPSQIPVKSGPFSKIKNKNWRLRREAKEKTCLNLENSQFNIKPNDFINIFICNTDQISNMNQPIKIFIFQERLKMYKTFSLWQNK